MLVRMAVLALVAHFVVNEVVLADTTLASRLEWWSYVARSEIGLDRLERVLSGYNAR